MVDNEDPSRTNSRNDIVLPKFKASNVEIDDPKRLVPNTETALPKRAQDRMDIALPKCKKSRTEPLDPHRAIPDTDTALPNLA